MVAESSAEVACEGVGAVEEAELAGLVGGDVSPRGARRLRGVGGEEVEGGEG